MNNVKLVILMAGKSTRMEPLNYVMPKGLMSLNQKPAIYDVVISLIAKGLTDLAIICNHSNIDLIKAFFNKVFSHKLNIEYLLQTEISGPLSALKLIKNSCNKEILLLLGDTICGTNFKTDKSWLGYSEITDQSHSRWCLIESDQTNKVTKLIDKPNYIPNTNKVLVGIYFFKNHKLLEQLLQKEYGMHRNEYQLSSLIEEYLKQEEMHAQKIDDWIDIGTLEDYSIAIKNKITGRYFNHFKINEYGILEKSSDYEGFVAEIEWYRTISKTPLTAFLPKLIDSKINQNNSGSYAMEYINTKTLAEYFVYYPITASNWKIIFSSLIKTIKLFWNYDKIPNTLDIEKASRFMYFEKTLTRISQWDRQDLVNLDELTVNNQKLLGFRNLWPKLEKKIENIISSSHKYSSIIHGDLSFQNILFHPDMLTFKFIDPRGEFGEKTIFGDNRYEAAKLRHCYNGNYDFIMSNLFSLKQDENNHFEYEIFSNTKEIAVEMDKELALNGFDIDEIEIIEGLLFISMIPLHKDTPEIQILFYLVGLEYLNKHI